MEVRCGQCSKLFRVADEKITGAGIRFKCTRCGEYITITRQDMHKAEPADAGQTPGSFESKPQKAPFVDPTPTPPSTPGPAFPSGEPEADEDFPPAMDGEFSLQDELPADDSLFSDPALQGMMQEAEGAADSSDDAFFAEPSLSGGLDEPLPGMPAEPEEGVSSGEFSFAEPGSQEQAAAESGGAALAGFDILEDHEAKEQAFPAQESGAQEAPSFLASPHEFTEEAIAGAPPVAVPEPGPVPQEPKKSDEQKLGAAALKPVPTPLAEQKQKPVVPPPPSPPPPAPKPAQTSDARPAPEPKTAQPTVKAPERPHPAPRPPQPPAALSTLDGVHPLVSGSFAGAVGGIGCTIPVAVMTLLGVGMLSMIAGGQKANLSMGQTLLMTGTSFMGLAILIGIILALFQAKTGRILFGFGGILLGGLISALIGAGMGIIVAGGSGAVVSTALILSAGFGWGIKGLLVSAAVVLARRMVMSNRTETSSAEISGGQLLGIGFALLVMVLGGIGEIRSASSLRTAKEDASQAIQDMMSSDGLQVTSSLASWDPANGDLLLNLTLENTTDEEKRAWYLVAKVQDAAGTVLTSVKMLSGKQLYGPKEYEAMTRRGVNIQAFRMEQMQQKEIPLPPHGVISVELRVIAPPAGVANFVAAFEPFDPIKMMREQMEEAVKQKEGQVQQTP